MSLLTLLILLVIIGILIFVIRSIVGVYRRNVRSPLGKGKFPVFSICMLSISLLLLVIGTSISLQVSDTLGGAIASLGGFFGLLESHVRHKREALSEKTADKDPMPE